MTRVLPDAIGHYFAGLVDGEGCFSIGKDRCEFILKLRADDLDVLEMLRRELGGIGKIYVVSSGGDTRTRRPQARWAVTRQRDLLFLTKLFDAYPLRSKKARDYAVWREAAINWAAGMPPAGLAAYKDQLAATRAYVEVPFPVNRLAKQAGRQSQREEA